MQIFIDETGSFSGIGKPSSISLIGALEIPDARKRSLDREYRKIRPYLPKEKNEVKGRLLSESEINKVIPILRHHEALFEVIGDIIVNATRRALVGNLQRSGWKDIPSLMIKRNPQNIQMVSLDDRVPKSVRLPYARILKAFDASGRQMLTADNRRDLLPDMPSFIRRVCSSFAPVEGVLRTRMV